jgi:hypothetical protein
MPPLAVGEPASGDRGIVIVSTVMGSQLEPEATVPPDGIGTGMVVVMACCWELVKVTVTTGPGVAVTPDVGMPGTRGTVTVVPEPGIPGVAGIVTVTTGTAGLPMSVVAVTVAPGAGDVPELRGIVTVTTGTVTVLLGAVGSSVRVTVTAAAVPNEP